MATCCDGFALTAIAPAPAEPTIAGFATGRDEIVDRAPAYIRGASR